MSNTDVLFTPVQVGDLTLPNRIVLAPLTRSRAGQPGNVPTPLMAEYYTQRAGAGLEDRGRVDLVDLVVLERRQGDRRGGVAGHHQQLDAPLDQKPGRVERIPGDHPGRRRL